MILYRGKVYNFNLIQNEVIKINTYIVKPLSSKKENIFLILAFFILILVAAIALKIRQRVEYKIDIKEDEIVSYEVLNNIELGIYSDIKNSLFLLLNRIITLKN